MSERPPRTSILDKLPGIKQLKERQARRLAAETEEMSRREVEDFLIKHDLLYYVPNRLRRSPEMREKYGAWSAVFSSPEGIALLKKYDQLAAEVSPDLGPAVPEHGDRYKDEEEYRGISMYHVRQWIEETPLKDHASLDTLDVVMRLGLLQRGIKSYEKHRVIERYLKSTYFAEGDTNKKLVDLPMIIERVTQSANAVDVGVMYRAIQDWFSAPDQKDLSLGTISQFCSQWEKYSAELKQRGNNDHWWIVEHYLPVMFANDVCPEAVPPMQLRSFLDGLMDLASQEKINETVIIRTLVPALVQFPQIQQSMSVENVRAILSNLRSLTNVNEGNVAALIYSLFSYKNHLDVSKITINNWHQTVGRRYDDLSRAAGRGSREAFGTIDAFARILDLNTEWETFTEYIQKYVRGSTLDLKLLARMSQVSTPALPLLRNTLEHKPASLVKVVRMLEIAELFDIKLAGMYEQLTPLQHLPREQLDALISQSDGESKLEKRFKKLQRKNERSDKAKDIRSLVTRLVSARSRSDKAAETQLLSELTIRFANEYQLYFERLFNDQIVKRARSEFGVHSPNTERINSDVFLRSYEMYRRLAKARDYSVEDTDRALAKKLIASYLDGKTDFITSEPANVSWLAKHLPESGDTWLATNEREFGTESVSLKSNVEKRQQHFFAVGVRLLQELRPDLSVQQMGPSELVQAFRSLAPDGLTPQQEALYQDLKVQVRGLEQTNADAYAGERPQKIRIMRETDPGVALMLGTWVSGSCFDASGMNYWASFPDAMEANKGVFWIKDEKDRILGRVLMAIDKSNKLTVFPTYYAGLGVDLDPYVDEYARELANKLRIELNGKAKDVERLLWSRWTSDPERRVLS